MNQVDDGDKVYRLQEKAVLVGHSGWVTTLAAGNSTKMNQTSNLLISGSRDKTLILWELDLKDQTVQGKAKKQFTGHSHFVSDIALSAENTHFVSSSWDKTLRLWNISLASSVILKGHEKEVLSVSFSHDNSRILSSSADKTIRVWNIKGEERSQTDPLQNHKEWVSCVRFLGKGSKSTTSSSYFATTGWDGRLKIWSSTDMRIKDSFKAHEFNINHLAVSSFGKYIATGGKDKKVNLWNVNDTKSPQIQFTANAPIHQLAFNPLKEIIAVGTQLGVQVWKLNDSQSIEINVPIEKKVVTSDKEKVDKYVPKFYECVSLTWDATGKYIFAGYTDNKIHVYELKATQK